MSAGWDGIAADIFVDILLRIPPCPRRRLRLVCRHWRDVIDERTREPRACAKLLVFYNKRSRRYSGGAYVFDDLTRGLGRKLNLQGSGVGERMIGTCNGLLCLQEREIAVINPSIRGESIAVDLPPTVFHWDDSSYSFGYHPATGQYKIVHVPCSRMQHGSELDAVHVLTLGDGPSAWREVPAPAGWSSCLLRLGLASIGGVTYWATKDGDRIMSFDLEDERVVMPADVPRLPVLALPHRSSESWQLTDVSGRLGLVVCYLPDELKRSSKTEVWVLEGGGEVERRTWVKRYTVLAHGAYPRQQIALPHVAHAGHVLTTSMPSEFGDSNEKTTLEAHWPREEGKMRPCGMVLFGAPRPETTIGLYNCAKVSTNYIDHV